MLKVSASGEAELETSCIRYNGTHKGAYTFRQWYMVQRGATSTNYFLGDALGSVRQLVDGDGLVMLARTYDPYGDLMDSAGSGASNFGYTGEAQVGALVYLRARFYAPRQGRFLSRDSWEGDYTRPLSLNGWNYVEANSINYTDPSGQKPWCPPGGNPAKCNDWNKVPMMCDKACLENATKRLNDWTEINTLPNPEMALFMRLLLSEQGWRLISNANWRTEGMGILWTLKNRVRWETERVIEQDKTKISEFKPCHHGYIPCGVAAGQYSGMQDSRARDPLYTYYADPEQRQRSYFHNIDYVPIAIERAYILATLFIAGAKDPTDIDGGGGAHYFSHKPTPNTHFSRQVDPICDGKLVADNTYKKPVLEFGLLTKQTFLNVD